MDIAIQISIQTGICDTKCFFVALRRQSAFPQSLFIAQLRYIKFSIFDGLCGLKLHRYIGRRVTVAGGTG